MNTQRIEILKQTKGKDLEDKAIERLKWLGGFEYIQMSEERLREAYLGTFTALLTSESMLAYSQRETAQMMP